MLGLLEEAYGRIKAAASAIGLSFSTHKTDLMHWRTPKERADKCEYPIVIDAQCVEPAPKAVKWLGFHFKPNHNTWTHFAKRLALAQAAFERIKRLSSISKSTHLPPIPHEACEGWGAKLSNSS